MSRLRRTRQAPQWLGAAIVVISLVIMIVSGAVIASHSHMFHHDNNSENSASEKEKPQEVSQGILDKMKQGTALSFGAQSQGKHPVIAVVGDTAKLSRSQNIVQGKPSELLNAIRKQQVSMYVYPVSHDKPVATDSVTRAAICRIGAEKTPSGIFTLNSIVSIGDKLSGNEDVKKVSSMMKMSANVKCPVKTNEAASQTSTNAEFFQEHFGLGRDDKGDTAVIVGNEYITHIDQLPHDWVKQVIQGKALHDIMG